MKGRIPTSLTGHGCGVCIGPYKLLRAIGEGGMGKVWIAEQHEPVRRRVALKVIKPGMDSRQQPMSNWPLSFQTILSKQT